MYTLAVQDKTVCQFENRILYTDTHSSFSLPGMFSATPFLLSSCAEREQNFDHCQTKLFQLVV